METVWVLITVMIALFATWGALSIWRGLFAWFFAPTSVRGCVVVSCDQDLENLDFLLAETGRSCTCRRGVSPVVLMDSELAARCTQTRAAGLAPLCGELSLRACLDKHGAQLYLITLASERDGALKDEK